MDGIPIKSIKLIKNFLFFSYQKYFLAIKLNLFLIIQEINQEKGQFLYIIISRLKKKVVTIYVMMGWGSKLYIFSILTTF